MIPLLLFSLYNFQLYLQEFSSKSMVETRPYRRNSYLAKIRRKPAWNIFVHRYSPSAFSRFINPIFAKPGDCRYFLFKKSGDFILNREVLKSWKKKKKEGYFCNTLICERSLLIYFPLNAGVFSIKRMLFYRNFGDYEDWYLVSRNIQTCMSINTRLGGKSWFWRKAEFTLILKLILIHMGQIASKATSRRCSWK